MARETKKPPPPPTRRAFAERLRAHRLTAEYETAKEFAAALGIEHGTYTRWERAETEPNFTNLLRITSLLKITPDVLLLPPAKARPEPDIVKPLLKRTA